VLLEILVTETNVIVQTNGQSNGEGQFYNYISDTTVDAKNHSNLANLGGLGE